MSANQIIMAIVIGLIVALIATGIMRAGLKSVSRQYTAGYYIKEEGLKLTKNKDVFMYTRMEKVPKPKEQPKVQQRR